MFESEDCISTELWLKRSFWIDGRQKQSYVTSIFKPDFQILCSNSINLNRTWIIYILIHKSNKTPSFRACIFIWWHYSSWTKWFYKICMQYKTHKSKIKDQGGQEGVCVTEMLAVLSSNNKIQKTLNMYTQSS